MLDNFGMGEFLMLAFFALLFFGPERLPELGARVGRWLSQLTQYSKAFMTQWSEEAGAIQDAMQEVKGIRDEIRAAQVEISQSLNTARQDITDTIDEAKGSIQEATPKTGEILKVGPPPVPATAPETESAQLPVQASLGNDDDAIARSQQIVDDLLRKRGLAPQSEVNESDGEEQADGDGAEPAVSATGTEGATEDEAYLRNLKAAQEIMDRGAQRVTDKEAQQDHADQQVADSQETEQAAAAHDPESESGPRIESVQEATVQENAFDKTQRILDQLMGQEPESSVAQETAPSELEETDATVDQPGGVAEAPGEIAQAGPTPEIAPATHTAVPTDGIQRAKGPEVWVSYSQFSRLSIEVTQLQRELRALREELQGLHVQAPSQGGTDQAASADGSAEQVALPVTEESSEAVSMEEAA
jgi:Sec-independent protein translocase protein TatA